MKTKIESGAPQVVLTLNRVELLHLEAGMDAFTELTTEDAREVMGGYEDEFDHVIAHAIWDMLDDIRDEIGGRS